MRIFLQTRLKRLQGESGAAFFFALLVMAFAMVFASFLLTQTQTASRQAIKTSESLESRLMSEAGIDYYNRQLEAAIAANQTGNAFDITLPDGVTHELDDTHRFTIENITSILNGDRLTVTYTSVGQSGTGEVEILHQTVIAP